LLPIKNATTRALAINIHLNLARLFPRQA